MKTLTTIILISLSLNTFSQKFICEAPYCLKLTDSINDTNSLNFKNIGEQLKNKKIIALGESTHGTKEFFELKCELIKYLIENSGFKYVVFEASMRECDLLNDYIHTGIGDPKILVARLGYWTWYTQEVIDLTIWMHDYNETHPNKIYFKGFDFQSSENSVSYLKSIKNELNQDLSENVNLVLNVFNRINDLQLAGIYQLSQSLLDSTSNSCKKLKDYINSNKSLLQNNITDSLYRNIKINTELLWQYSIQSNSSIKPDKLRDSCMAENFNWLYNNNPDSKYIIWTHNGHIKSSEKAMGQYLKQTYNDSIAIIGLTTSRGTYTALNGAKIDSNPLSLPDSSSYEYYFEKFNTDNFFINLHNIPDDLTKYLISPNKLREIGSMRRDEQFSEYNLFKDFDMIIYLKKTSSSKVLY